MDLHSIQQELAELADPAIAQHSQRFFKTGPGEYGEGDRFRGIRVPVLRKLARSYQTLSVQESEKLLRSPFHEDRLLALFILVRKFERGEEEIRRRIYDLYLDNTTQINNWDLVDSSAPQIVGAYLWDRETGVLTALAHSLSLWERRIAIMATLYFIKRGRFEETMEIAHLLLDDPEDLIHKAVGWMLREIGNRDMEKEEAFLRPVYRQMPRTMLRYAIEKFPEVRRSAFLKGEV